MATKTSKTAHVMGLLNKTELPEGSEDTALKSAPAPTVRTPVVEIEQRGDDTSASDAVRAALEQETVAAASTPVAEAPTPAPVAEAPAPATAEEAPASPSVADVTPEAARAYGQTRDHVVTDMEAAYYPIPDDFKFVNVMQILVSEKAKKYMSLFGLCQCPRCFADVNALALNNLPPKYVVHHPGEVIPKLTIYEGRYDAAITTQVTRACRAIMDTPHHDR